MKTHLDALFESGLPSSPDAERYILASLLLGHQPVENVAATLQPGDFSLERHKRIYLAILHLAETGTAIDYVTVVDELARRGQLESVDGMSYITSLTEGMPELAHLDSYVSMVRDKSILRQAIIRYHTLIQDCFHATDPTSEILARAQQAISDLTAETVPAGFRTPMEVVNRAGGITTILSPDSARGIPTPWPGLNRMLVGGGLLPGQMTVIGARPSMGKTALACQIVGHAATHGVGVAFFTLEMSDAAILMRMAAARAEVDTLKLTQGLAMESEKLALSSAYADLTDEDGCRLWIDDTTGCTIPAMRSALRRLAARHNIGLVVIDYLQLVETSGGSERRRYEQVSEISRGIKRLARDFNLPVVVLAQLNRDLEREDRRPRLSDLRDSGSIEQDADVVLLPARRAGQEDQSNVVEMDLIIAKQRNGPQNVSVPLRFTKRHAKFVERGA